ncbi:olfactory receptor 1002-like [Microcaecilia unicolor]|uniref:Olfactory receptor 1002-like n=1 Tax=Microcaecilia unicolor TaxID=1415580 RepID=A0A6P7X2D5_9AMPH|nr:olfactory receptor 1002-like [Microcaecilia unicolor]
MKGKNQTSVTEFILLGFSDLPKLQSLLFVMFLIMYILTLLGNISITTIVRVDPQLHKPMYYFLTNLSFVDICYSSTITPKALVDFKVEENTISLLECATQLFMFINMTAAECLLLTVMSYDRYVAICNPLHYPVVMTRRVCGQMMIGVYIFSTVCSFMHTVNIFSVNFCGSNKINHFYCDAHPLLKLSCSDTFFNEMVLSILAGIVGFLSVITIVLSYILIISAILRIRSSEGRHKAFSTCASHLFTVILFFGTLTFIYVIPSSQFSLYINRVLSVIYTMVIPMVNPMIYSLRNKDVKQALRKILEKRWFSESIQLIILWKMKGKNQTFVTEFILLGFSDLSNLQSLLFVVFLVMYVLNLLGNISIITLIRIDPHLRTPMYFFLTNLSFVDICYSSTVTPKALVDFKVEKSTISLFECATQLCIFVTVGTTECFLLVVMAYDRYVAICNPLLYTVVMTRRVCICLVISAYMVSTVYSLIQTINTFSMTFCGSNEINHFYCDIPPLFKLSCSDTYSNEVVLSILAGIVGVVTVTAIVLSYTFIISSILRIRSSEGRRKAFSTCASHFTTVILFFGTLIFMYVIPSSHFSLSMNRMVSVVYTMAIPMVNPMIYSFRNKDVKQALRKVLEKKLVH